ncbi:MAG: RnfABCDGE type electron transport complex subunit B [Alphaproteobacteria bacterium]|nr:RnfABCDGE type electron transport complex subunit B [Alphaproteobacteria bacterium]
MDNLIWLNALVLGGVAFVAAFVLYFVSRRFYVAPDETAEKIAAELPQANCGGCGYAGCSDFASACSKADENGFANLYCPVGGAKVMNKVAKIKGFSAAKKKPSVAVLHCQGTCSQAPAKVIYDAVSSCRIANQISVGKSGCPQGCLHLGDCVKVCKFGALSFDETTQMPVVDRKKCTSCGACVKACPRGLFEIRELSAKGALLYVACRNTQKGAAARKNCLSACIGCQKCSKLNSEIKVENNLSIIPMSVDADEWGQQLAEACPTKAIVYKEKSHA